MLNYDIILRILDTHRSRNDYNLLAQCALVNREWNCAASRLLYERVVIAPPFKPVLDLRDKGEIPESSNFLSAILPKYVPYVLLLEISGYPSPRPPPRNILAELLPGALKTFINLCSAEFTPVTCYTELFRRPLSLLLNATSLTSLTVNSFCSDESHASQLVQISGLHSLTLVNPGRAILQLLPDWLARLSMLTELHLKDNCGSVTPGVLKAILPYINDTVHAFTLGLSYSLTNSDVFTFLGQLSRLRRVNLRYFWQLRPPAYQLPLPTMRAFTVAHEPMGTSREVADFDAWIRRAVRRSPALHTLRVACEPAAERLQSHPTAHDGLLDHIVQKHAGTLHALELASGMVSLRRLKQLLETCVKLEDLTIAVDKQALNVFAQHSGHLKQLRSVAFQVINMPKQWGHERLEQKAREIILNGPPLLRGVQINDMTWEVLWSEGGSMLVIQQKTTLVPPWRRVID